MAESVRRLLARRVDGPLVLGDGLRAEMRSVTAEFSVPVAYAFGLTDREGDSCYVPDSRMAGRLAGEHLLSLGRRRIAHITGEAADSAATGREQGLLAALAEAGLPPATGTLRGDWSRAWGAAACRRLIGSGARFDAVSCGNDQIALGAESVLRESGRRVPDDVALVGVDNWEYVISGRSTRHLTTVDTGLAALGAAAAAQVADGRDAPGTHAHPVHTGGRRDDGRTWAGGLSRSARRPRAHSAAAIRGAGWTVTRAMPPQHTARSSSSAAEGADAVPSAQSPSRTVKGTASCTAAVKTGPRSRMSRCCTR
ncbi:substrate-binding domain-containing protein [Streptomyces sp. NPDC002215]|uniref:substrate-binding domain-containing protein n=1 Tax=Streptomyces sp. NPDC002215 TaxID=3154412 RepID=UPI00331DF733